MFNSSQIPSNVPHYSESEIAAACWKWGKQLWVPAGIDGPKLLFALSGCESSFGADCKPRHEMAYCTGAYSANPEVEALTRVYGCAAHCSYGPWQILLVNCIGAAPQDMLSLNRAAMETVGFINRRILKREGASTVAEVADAYNSGDWRDANKPAKYMHDCIAYYISKTMPDEVMA
jgi:hypothetical protein